MLHPSDSDQLLTRGPVSHYWLLIAVFLLLSIIGLANLYSATNGGAYFVAQLRHMCLGLAAFVTFGWFIPIRYVNTYSYVFYGFTALCLAVVLILGYTAGGAQRWVVLGPIRFQPSEMAKIALAMMVAKYFYNNKAKSDYRISELWPVLACSFFIFALIFIQPDFGTAGICLIVVLVQLAFVRLKIDLKTVLGLAAGGISCAAIGWSFLLKDYQKLRILNLLNPNLDPSGSGYNSLQSLVAIGSGKQFGKGFMEGTQSQLQFLPARHTDFIFSVFAEEHGFWGSTLVFVLFAVIAYLSLEIARSARDSFGAILSLGMGGLIFVEFTINVAMVLGIFPVVGMPLPFFSYGGSALITLCLAMGLLVAIDRDSARAHRRLPVGPVKS